MYDLSYSQEYNKLLARQETFFNKLKLYSVFLYKKVTQMEEYQRRLLLNLNTTSIMIENIDTMQRYGIRNITVDVDTRRVYHYYVEYTIDECALYKKSSEWDNILDRLLEEYDLRDTNEYVYDICSRIGLVIKFDGCADMSRVYYDTWTYFDTPYCHMTAEGQRMLGLSEKYTLIKNTAAERLLYSPLDNKGTHLKDCFFGNYLVNYVRNDVYGVDMFPVMMVGTDFTHMSYDEYYDSKKYTKSVLWFLSNLEHYGGLVLKAVYIENKKNVEILDSKRLELENKLKIVRDMGYYVYFDLDGLNEHLQKYKD